MEANLPKLNQDELFAKFLKENKILIADESAGVRTRAIKALVDLGATRTSIASVPDYDSAKQSIKEFKPKLILCDFMLGKKSGLDLIQEQRAEVADVRSSIFALITGSNAQSTVARAAEEDVDLFILKPYTKESLNKALVTATIAKLYPSKYIQTIEKGKELLFKGAPDEAIVLFNQAMELDKNPTLACFYLGQANLIKKALDDSADHYQKGLTYQKIHYKCLVGLFDLLFSQKKYPEAYQVVKRLAMYFPANPKRLATVLRLAITTGSYEDMEGYYRIFTNIDERSNELIMYMCSALVVTGKFYLTSKQYQRAIDVFNNAIVSSAGRTKFYKYSIESLLEKNFVKESEEILNRFDPTVKSSVDFQVSNYLISCKKNQPKQNVYDGKILIKNNVHDPLIYQLMIENSLKIKDQMEAEFLLKDAITRWPELTDKLQKLYNAGLEEKQSQEVQKSI